MNLKNIANVHHHIIKDSVNKFNTTVSGVIADSRSQK